MRVQLYINYRKLVHMNDSDQLSLLSSAQTVNEYRSRVSGSASTWEGNRRSGVGPAMHASQTLWHVWYTGR